MKWTVKLKSLWWWWLPWLSHHQNRVKKLQSFWVNPILGTDLKVLLPNKIGRLFFLGSSELCHLWRTSTFTPDSCVDFDCLVGGTVLEVHKMFLNGYRDYHSLLNVVVSCGLNNIPRYSDQQTIVQLKCLAESIHSLNKENKVIFATVPYAPKFCHSMRYASMKMI